MANILRCPSSGYSYTYSGESRQGTGRDEETARADALAKFPKDAESKAKKDAIDDATNDYDCDGSCQLNVNVGAATFAQTSKAGVPPTLTVTVTIQVPVTLSCGQRQVTLVTLAETPILVDIPVGLPLPEGEVIDQASTSIIAYVSALQRTVFVTAGRVDDATKALEAVKVESGWQLPGSTDIFTLTEVEGDPAACAYDAAGVPQALKAPQRADRRVKDHHTCGRATPASSGPCKPIGDGSLYIKGDRTPIAFCVFSRGRQCVEYYREVATVGFYKDKDCQNLVFEYGLNGWTCLGLF